MKDNPHGAVHHIIKALCEGHDATTMAKYIEADHKTDDRFPSFPHNRKTMLFGDCLDRVRRMKEVKNGELLFVLKTDHAIKTHKEGDLMGEMTVLRKLYEKRKAATEKLLKKMDVSDLLKFTKTIHEQGLEWPLQQFLMTVLPWWQKRAAENPLELPAVKIDDPSMLELQSCLIQR